MGWCIFITEQKLVGINAGVSTGCYAILSPLKNTNNTNGVLIM